MVPQGLLKLVLTQDSLLVWVVLFASLVERSKIDIGFRNEMMILNLDLMVFLVLGLLDGFLLFQGLLPL